MKKKIVGWTIKSDHGIISIGVDKNNVDIYTSVFIATDLFMFETREEAQRLARNLKRKYNLSWTKTVPVYLVKE